MVSAGAHRGRPRALAWAVVRSAFSAVAWNRWLPGARPCCRCTGDALGVDGIEALFQQVAVRGGAIGSGSAECKVACVWCNHGVVNQTKVGVDAGPAMALGAFRHGGSHRVELDITVHGHHVALGADDAGLEAALP